MPMVTVNTPPTRVLVLDGQRTFADAVARCLEAEDDLTVVAVVPSARLARFAMTGRDVNVILVDADLPNGAALRLCAEVSGKGCPPFVIMLSASAETERIVAAIRVGVAGWVRKTETMEYLLRVIGGVMQGETWVPVSELGQVFQLMLRQQKHVRDDDLLAPLTARERQILSHMAGGAGRNQIAERLQLSPHTVRSHMQSLMRKLGAHSAVQAVALTQSKIDDIPF